MIAISDRAFVVSFAELKRWDPGSFHGISWRWPAEDMKPIGSVLRQRKEKVDRKQHTFADLQPVTIHFDGSVDRRKVDANREYTMDLFFAHPDDVVAAKIDLKNGAVGVIPPEWDNVVVTNHFAVYEPDLTQVSPHYLHLVVQLPFFKSYLWRNKVGAEGRKEVKLDFFEAVEIPLPPLDVQQAIVKHWRHARQEAQSIREHAVQMEAVLRLRFYQFLGVTPPLDIARPKYIVVQWKELSRWSFASTLDYIFGLDKAKAVTYEYAPLGSIADVSYGIQKCPANRPGQHARPYLRVANVRKGYLDLSEVKEINVPDSEFKNYKLEIGDLLFVEGNGSRAELGRVAMWNGEIQNCVHQNHLIKVRAKRALMPEFAMLWFNTEVGRGHFFRAAKTSSGLGTINSSEVRNAPIPLPPLDVQEEIIQRIRQGRAEIARERQHADERERAARADVEAMILGVLPPA